MKKDFFIFLGNRTKIRFDPFLKSFLLEWVTSSEFRAELIAQSQGPIDALISPTRSIVGITEKLFFTRFEFYEKKIRLKCRDGSTKNYEKNWKTAKKARRWTSGGKPFNPSTTGKDKNRQALFIDVSKFGRKIISKINQI